MQFTLREPGSSLTHFLGMLITMVAAFPLLGTAFATNDTSVIFSISIFISSMILLYGASATYHGLNISGRKLRVFRKIDHIMIFVLIAGSYTPICLISLKDTIGYHAMFIIWGIALIGILIKAFWITCPKWFSSLLYIAMGWVCIFMIKEMYLSMPKNSLIWLFVGGIIYTLGGILYALKLKLFNQLHPHFGSHEIFHLFIMGGSICHFLCMYYLIP